MATYKRSLPGFLQSGTVITVSIVSGSWTYLDDIHHGGDHEDDHEDGHEEDDHDHDDHGDNDNDLLPAKDGPAPIVKSQWFFQRIFILQLVFKLLLLGLR